MLHDEYQPPEISGSEGDFLIFSMYFYGSNPGPPGIGPFWTSGPSSKQLGKGQLGNAISQILSTSAKQF